MSTIIFFKFNLKKKRYKRRDRYKVVCVLFYRSDGFIDTGLKNGQNLKWPNKREIRKNIDRKTKSAKMFDREKKSELIFTNNKKYL